MDSREQQGGVQSFFETDADGYDARHYGSGHRTYIGDRQACVSSVFRDLVPRAGSRILDIACGPGRFLSMAQGAGLVALGIDASTEMLRTSARRLGAEARLVLGSATSLPFASSSFDALNCSGLIEYLDDPSPVFREAHRVLTPGGWMMMSSTNRRSPALVLEPLIEVMRRSRVFRLAVRALRLPGSGHLLRERRFRFFFHSPEELHALCRGAGFARVRMHYYHLQLLPHPMDRLSPALTTACVRWTDRFLTRPRLGRFAEGLLAVGYRDR